MSAWLVQKGNFQLNLRKKTVNFKIETFCAEKQKYYIHFVTYAHYHKNDHACKMANENKPFLSGEYKADRLHFLNC